ncbi:signal peptidase I [Vibrio alfacsensis]|uniref:signal peptidase I n=1 Tax=Vibrio alfacsensis TaxID=1074311 RepID=UPI0040676878
MKNTEKIKNIFSTSNILIFTIVLFVKLSIIDWYHIPSGSMMPTLEINDRVVVNKFAYHFQIPLLNTTFTQHAKINRGDVVIFEEKDSGTIFIKRVIGVAGDTIEINFHQVSINGKQIDTTLVSTTDEYTSYREKIGSVEYFTQYNNSIDIELTNILKHKEDLIANPNSKSAKFVHRFYHNRAGKWIVPEKTLFVMGDNRDNSIDSRFASLSTIPINSVRGKAMYVFANIKPLNVGGVNLHMIPIGFSQFNKEIYTAN